MQKVTQHLSEVRGILERGSSCPEELEIALHELDVLHLISRQILGEKAVPDPRDHFRN